MGARIEAGRLGVPLALVRVAAGVVPRAAPLGGVRVRRDGVLAAPEPLLLLLLLMLDVLEHLHYAPEAHAVVLEDHVELRVANLGCAAHGLALQVHEPVPVFRVRLLAGHRSALGAAPAKQALHLGIPAFVEPQDWEGEDDENHAQRKLRERVLHPTGKTLMLYLGGCLDSFRAKADETCTAANQTLLGQVQALRRAQASRRREGPSSDRPPPAFCSQGL
mmetsp:Transcript_9833/g.29437  ORF Transcript_9833/g.29437 Transcript_9833/m.29437 type:complete len:220 (+) Transcript_9833:308-967(+)